MVGAASLLLIVLAMVRDPNPEASVSLVDAISLPHLRTHLRMARVEVLTDLRPPSLNLALKQIQPSPQASLPMALAALKELAAIATLVQGAVAIDKSLARIFHKYRENLG